MAQNDRPGGLIALAVINFVFCAFDGLAALGLIFLLVMTHVGQGLMVDSGPSGIHASASATASSTSVPTNSASTTTSATSSNATASTTTSTITTQTTVVTSSDGSDGDDVPAPRHRHLKQPLLTPEQAAKAKISFGVSALANGVCAVLLLVSGIGYIRQRKVQGRFLGTAYGVVALVSMVVERSTEVPVQVPTHHAIGIMTLIAMIYPVLTILLVNTVFRDDLAN